MSNTSYKQIIPATDWYFRHDNVSVWQESQQYTNWLHGRLKKMVR